MNGTLLKCIDQNGNIFPMIKISIDESSAFDILSIYQLKSIYSETEEKRQQNLQNIKELSDELIEQIGELKFNEVIESEEYIKLYIANMDTFEMVDKAKTDEVPASAVDYANHQRYLCKSEIQKRFFNTNLSETKTGYEKLKNYGNNTTI